MRVETIVGCRRSETLALASPSRERVRVAFSIANRSGEHEAYSFGLIAQQSAEADLVVKRVERVHVR
jgi:hypothetical protein